jgi:hypothetical protein
MSNQPLTLRLNTVYKSTDGRTNSAENLTWYFSLLGGVTAQRQALTRGLVAKVNELYQVEARTLQAGYIRRQPEIARFNRQGFSIRPQAILSARRQSLNAPSEAEILFTWIGELEQFLGAQGYRADLLRALDHFSRLVVPSAEHSAWACGLLMVTKSRSLGDAHIEIVRNTWAQYLDWFLLNSPERSGLMQPDLIAEVMLEYPELDYLLVQKICERRPVTKDARIFWLPSYARLYEPAEINASLSRLVAAGILASGTYDPTQNGKNGEMDAEIAEGRNAKYIYMHRLPIL